MRTTGAPPVEIDAAWASASWPPCEAAQAWSAASDGNDTSDMRWKTDRLPPQPTVLRITLTDLRRNATRWLLLRPTEVSLCSTNPGFPAALELSVDRRTLVGWWRGDFDLGEARRRGLRLAGPAALVRAFPTWFQRYLLAEVAPA